jgi:SAM-dependent methyltransferase
VRDLLFLDWISVETSTEATSTSLPAEPYLAQRPFRIWEYSWLFKTLGLAAGDADVLDLGGPASHLTLLTALAGNRVVSLDINPQIIDAGRRCAERLGIDTLQVREGFMQDLSTFPDASVDRILCCSVMEHLHTSGQEQAIEEMARVLRPGGIVGMTFDYGPAAPGFNAHLPPPHEPPGNSGEVLRWYARAGLRVLGNTSIEPPLDGCLFRDAKVRYTIASLFLGKPPNLSLEPPEPTSRRESFLSRIRMPDLPYLAFREGNRKDRLLQTYVHTVLSLREENIVYRQAAEERLEVIRKLVRRRRWKLPW